MSAEMVSQCLQSGTSGCLSKSRRVMARVFVWGSQFWPAVWSQLGRDVKALSEAAAASSNKLVREMETYIYSGGSQCDQSDGSCE